jgi:hypothetical protein
MLKVPGRRRRPAKNAKSTPQTGDPWQSRTIAACKRRRSHALLPDAVMGGRAVSMSPLVMSSQLELSQDYE